jgi:hypothetical protein
MRTVCNATAYAQFDSLRDPFLIAFKSVLFARTAHSFS